MAWEVTKKRSSLPHARAALQNGTLTVGFIGGSITETRDMYRSYSDHVSNGIAAAFPDARIIFQNAGIGATGSSLGAFRVKQDIIDKGCDLLFIEYAVNDNGTEANRRMAAREGLLRQVLKQNNCDVVFVYTFCQEMYEDIEKGIVPKSIEDFETLADHYNISSVWMALHALNCVNNGILRWEEWLPDKIHPNVAGSRFYAEPVLDFVINELKGSDPSSFTFPTSLSPAPWENVHLIPLRDIQWKNPWKLRCVNHRAGYEEFLDTSAVGAELTIPFNGTGIFVGFICGMTSSAIEYRVDNGEWQISDFVRYEWMLENNYYRAVLLANDLASGEHTLTLRTKHKPDDAGTRTDIALVGVFE